MTHSTDKFYIDPMVYGKPINPSTNEAELRKQIEEVIDTVGIFSEEIRVTKPDGTSYITSDTTMLVNSLLDLIAQDRATQRHELEQAVMGCLPEKRKPSYMTASMKAPVLSYGDLQFNQAIDQFEANLALLFERK